MIPPSSAINVLGLAPLMQWVTGQSPPATTNRLPNQLLLATYNVWFDGLLQRERASALLDLLAKHHPDVVCLQEVTSRFISVLTNNNWWKNNYTISTKPMANAKSWYGVITMIRKPLVITSDVVVDFPKTNQGRRLHVIDFTRPSNHTVRVAQSHFESLNSKNIRRAQLRTAADHASSAEPTAADLGVVCGDMNLYDADEDNALEDVGLVDAWRAVEPSHRFGRTDSSSNENGVVDQNEAGATYGLTYPSKFPSKRLDRVGFTGGRDARVVEVRLIGDGEMKDFAGAWISDHLGVLVLFEIGRSDDTNASQ